MNGSRLVGNLIRVSNIVLYANSATSDKRKFIAWRTSKDGTKVQVLGGLKITDISPDDTKKIFEHPIETGGVITDGTIFEPQRVSVSCLIADDDVTTLKELEHLYLSSEILQIRAGNKVIDKVIINAKPSKIDSSKFNMTAYTIDFREVQEVSPIYVKMTQAKKKSSVSRVNTGQKQVKEVKKKSWLKSAIFGGRT